MIIALVVFASNAASNVPEDIAKQSVSESAFATNGIVSSGYIETSSYSLDDFKIDEQDDVDIDGLGPLPASASAENDKVRHVMFSGTIKNDYFETVFTGESYYAKQGDNWILISGPTVSDSHTIPLKGVSALNDSNASSGGQYSVTGFSSTLDEDNGTYTSKATQEIEYDFWFGKDTATITRDFVFDGAQWKPVDDVSVVESESTFDLNGKSFKTVDGGTMRNDQSVNTTITFTDDENADSIGGEYSLSFVNSGSSENYIPFSLEGSLSGAIKHRFGEDSFELTLYDSTNSVTFIGSTSSFAASAETGKAPTLTLKTTTDTVYYRSTAWGATSERKLQTTYQSFVEEL